VALSTQVLRKPAKNACIHAKSTPLLAVRDMAQFPTLIVKEVYDGNSQEIRS
jgi:hypothetical protein